MYRPAFPPTEEIDVYRTKIPDRPYIEIAELTTDASGDALQRLVEQAKAIGADGLIVLGERIQGTNVYPYGGPFTTFGFGLGFGRGVHPFGSFALGYDVYVDSELAAVAIRYEDRGAPPDRGAPDGERPQDAYPPRYR